MQLPQPIILFSETEWGGLSQNVTVLDKTATPAEASALPWSPGELSLCQRCSRAENPTQCWRRWGSSAMERYMEIQPEPPIRPCLGNHMLRFPLPHVEPKSQQQPDLTEADVYAHLRL